MKNKRNAKRRPVKRQLPRRHRSTAPKEKAFVRSIVARVVADDVELIPGRSKNIESGKRLYWHIYHAGKHAGHVSIDYYPEKKIGGNTSIDVQLNRQSRNRGIGTVAFRRACEMSRLPEVLASIRKSNTASRIAAERAGFVTLHDEPTGELLMIWRRS